MSTNTCKTCEYRIGYDVHYSGNPKVVYYCEAKPSKRTDVGFARTKSNNQACAMYKLKTE